MPVGQAGEHHLQPDDASLTNEMMQKFRDGEIRNINHVNTFWAIPHKDCAADACEKIRNRL